MAATARISTAAVSALYQNSIYDSNTAFAGAINAVFSVENSIRSGQPFLNSVAVLAAASSVVPASQFDLYTSVLAAAQSQGAGLVTLTYASGAFTPMATSGVTVQSTQGTGSGSAQATGSAIASASGSAAAGSATGSASSKAAAPKVTGLGMGVAGAVAGIAGVVYAL